VLLLLLLAAGVGVYLLGGWGEDEPITVYQWRDAEGTWHYADEAPLGVDAEAVRVAPVTVLPEPPPASEADGEGSSLGHLPKTLIDRAHRAGDVLEEQGRKLTEGLDPSGEP